MREIEISSIKGLLWQKETISFATAAILCSSNGLNPERFDWLEDKLILSFDDVEDPRRGQAFGPFDAQKIVAFVENLSPQGKLYFCCDAGESRSAALAAAFLRAWTRNDMKIWMNPYFHPNLLVYRIQCMALGIVVTEEELADLKAISDQALANAIRKAREEEKT